MTEVTSCHTSTKRINYLVKNEGIIAAIKGVNYLVKNAVVTGLPNQAS